MSIIFPQPFAFAIDDLGWNIGNNHGEFGEQGPFRIGLNRKMSINDYKCIVEVAKSAGVRVLGLFVLSEMDRENVLAKYPTTNVHGSNWDNTENVSQEQIEIMNYVRDNAAHLEFGLHGVGHEYWPEPGKRRRAEWYNKEDNHPWPEETIDNHIKCYKEILAQYQLAPENGHSFPQSFVPCSYAIHWDPTGDLSTGSKFNTEGVKFANTLFEEIDQPNLPSGPNGGGIDHGMLVVNRVIYGNEWYELSTLPRTPIEEQESSVIESHWSNWLAQDDFLQSFVNEEWINYYKKAQKQENRYIAKNSEQFNSQWLYNKYLKVEETEKGVVRIDNRAMPDDVYQHNLLGNLVLKVKLPEGKHVSSANINGENIVSYFEDQGFGFIYLPKLAQTEYTLTFEVGENFPDTYVYNDGTYNVYSLETNDNNTRLSLSLYGQQTVMIVGIEKPFEIVVDNVNVLLKSHQYDLKDRTLKMVLKAHDIQGEQTLISIK